MVYEPHLLIHSSVDGHSACSHVLAIVNSASVNTESEKRKGLPWWLNGKKSAYHAGGVGSIPVWEDSLEEGTATHSSILAWRSLWTEEPGRLQSKGSQRVRKD